MPALKKPVQVPGAAPADTTDSTAADQGDGNGHEAAKTTDGALTAADYATMHSSEVDATQIKKSVLCKDGWVVPDLPPQAAIRA